MQYCTKCIQPNTRPGIAFHDGLCGACFNWREDKGPEYWEPIEKELHALVSHAKANSKGGFDCIVGVSGGKDSHFQALYAKEKLGLNVLLVNSLPDAITDVGRRNMENLLQQGFDCIHLRTNPKVMRAITKRAFYEYGNPVKPSEYSLHASSFHVALAFGIPLVFLGEDPGTSLGVTKGWAAGGNAMNINEWNTLAGCHASDWMDDNIGLKDLLFFEFPDKNKMIEAGIKGAFMGYYVKEFSGKRNTDFAIQKGFQGIDIPEWYQRIYGYSKFYNSIDSEIYALNNLLKYYKMGWSDITALCSGKIRQGEMSREEAISYAEKYDSYCEPGYIENFCKYIDISLEEFWRVVGIWTDKKLFRQDSAGKWIPRFKVGIGIVDPA